jgi:hypothetical protein
MPAIPHMETKPPKADAGCTSRAATARLAAPS